jgi:hypothetical protein
MRRGDQIINYNNPAHPLILTLYYALTSEQSAAAVVAVKKDSNDTIQPFAVLKNGSATFNIAATGEYDMIYNAKVFGDADDHWAKDYITFVAARDMFNGTGNNNFTPNGSMTRAMFVKVLANLEQADLSSYEASKFSDVPTGQWYSTAVEWAADKGIVNGVGNDRFDPNAPITREQMAVMLHNYIEFREYILPLSANEIVFTDDSKLSPWAKDSVSAIQRAGIISGRPGNIFDPQSVATRGEGATIYAKFIEAVATISK